MITTTLLNDVSLAATGAANTNPVGHAFDIASKLFALEVTLDNNGVNQGEDDVSVEIHFGMTESLAAPSDAPVFFFGSHMTMVARKLPHENSLSVKSTPQIGITGETLYAWVDHSNKKAAILLTLKVVEL